MKATTLAKLFTTNYRALRANVQDVAEAESHRLQQPGGNSLNWVLGHVVASRSHVLRLLGEEPPWSETQSAPYERGSRPGAAPPMTTEQILADLERTQQLLVRALERTSEAELAVPCAKDFFGSEDLGEKLAFLHFHEAYHTGQSGLLRRLLGKPGAIQ